MTTRWFNDERAVCAYLLRDETCSIGIPCHSEPSCLTDAPGGPGSVRGWPSRKRRTGGFVIPEPTEGGEAS